MNETILKCIDELVNEYGYDKQKLIDLYKEDLEQLLQYAKDDKVLKD